MRALARTLRALVWPFAASVALAPLACDPKATSVTLVSARALRGEAGHLLVEVVVDGAEQAGGSVGQYCVSMHVMPFGHVPTLVDNEIRYATELDYAGSCQSDLGDGDRRTFLLGTQRVDLPPGQPIRVQARIGRTFDVEELFAP